MENFSLFSFIILLIVAIAQTGSVQGNSVCGGIFEGDAGEIEYHRENAHANFDDVTGTCVCVWMIKLLKPDADGAGVSVKLEDLDENSVVNFYDEAEPTDPVNTPITLNSTQVNSAVELSGKIFIIPLKTQSQLGQFENPATKLVLSWSLKQSSNTDSTSHSSKILPVEVTSTNYFASGGETEKGRHNLNNFYPHQKSVWILDAGSVESGSLNAEVNVNFHSFSCPSKLKSTAKSGRDQSQSQSQKALCECSYFGLFEILPDSGKLRLVNEFCGRPGSLTLTELSSQLVVFIYSKDPNSGSGSGESGESVEISWEKNKGVTTEPPTTTAPPIKIAACPDNSTISPCICWNDPFINRFDIWCSGPAVSQTTIETAFKETRRVNQIPEDQGLDLFQFKLINTALTQLDLAPLYKSRMEYLTLRNNSELTQLVTSGNPEDHGSINVHYVFTLEDSPGLNGDGIGETLKYFTNDLRRFDASGINLNKTSDSDSNAIFPGLSVHTNLTELALQSCNITGKLTSSTWNFKGLGKLGTINLSYNNITKIGENVFDFVLNDDRNDPLYIYLDENELNDTSFHPNSGIARIGHKTVLVLNYNQITTLPAHIFETFLDAHEDNYLALSKNPLLCDERLSWIKSRKDELRHRVPNTACSNDPGHSVFDSDLIP